VQSEGSFQIQVVEMKSESRPERAELESMKLASHVVGHIRKGRVTGYLSHSEQNEIAEKPIALPFFTSLHMRTGAGIAQRYSARLRTVEDWGFESRQGLGILLFTAASRPALGPTQPPIQCVPGDLSLVREADHSPPSSAEVKNVWSYTSTPQYTFTAWCSVKAQGQLYL
jgi:hypothetical protein